MNNSVITHNSIQMWVSLEVRRSQSFTPPAPHTDTHPWSEGTAVAGAPDVRCYTERERPFVRHQISPVPKAEPDRVSSAGVRGEET